MAYFQELNEIVLGIIGEYLLKNQNLCKMLYYYPDSEDLNYNPIAEENIPDTSVLLFKHIFPLPKMPDAILDQKGYLTVTLTGGNEVDVNTGFRRVNVQFDIIYHLNAWAVYNGFRPYYVASEIDSMFNNKQLTIPIVNKCQYYGFRMKDYSNYFYGIQLIYELYVDSNINCDHLPLYYNTPFIGRINRAKNGI